MPGNVHRESATILQFPVGFRKPVKGVGFDSRLDIDLTIPAVCAEALDGSWYHAEAVRKSDPEFHN